VFQIVADTMAQNGFSYTSTQPTRSQITTTGNRDTISKSAGERTAHLKAAYRNLAPLRMGLQLGALTIVCFDQTERQLPRYRTFINADVIVRPFARTSLFPTYRATTGYQPRAYVEVTI
jgi:hypothetical protein